MASHMPVDNSLAISPEPRPVGVFYSHDNIDQQQAHLQCSLIH